ncbi:MAG: hypothetical protein JXA21_05315 [Anaerolineae bacterium]|nr:hypothetical protein [Anaerolineae bacterium]
METQSGPISADYKVAGGKLLRVRLQVQSGAITAINITGDFFMHPEEAIETLEQMLVGVDREENAVRVAVQAFFATDVQVVGADVDDFVHLILSAGPNR